MNANKILTKSTLILIGLMIALSACSTRSIDAASTTPVPSLQPPASTPTLPPTQAASSATAVPTQAPAPTPTSTQPPTSTPSPEPTNVIFYPTPVVDAPCTYRATFLGDVTIPDNTVIAPGAAFVKTWRLRNDGTCAWGSNGYALRTLVFVNGDRLGAPNVIALPGEVQPGGMVDLSVQMIAPTAAGTYRSEWLLSIDGGYRIGVGYIGSTPLSTQIVVGSAAIAGDGNCTYRGTFLGDVTMPDNISVAPGAAFLKTWRIRNDGTCAWGSNGYALHSLVFTKGDRLSAPDRVLLPGEVPPGTTIDLSVNMIAPIDPGHYRSEWRLLAEGGPIPTQLIGFGAYGNLPLYVQIVVQPAVPIGLWQTYFSSNYQYAIDYPADWTVQVNTSVPSGAGTNPEYVTLTSNTGGLPRIEIEVLTGIPPMTGFENCVKNYVFHNLPACKLSLPAGQNPAAEVWVFQRGAAYFYIQMQYEDASSLQVFTDVMTSFKFTP